MSRQACRNFALSRSWENSARQFIGNLTARYSLGFTLAEDENDDGRMHQLEVRVKAPDEKGKKRKLQVTSRQGYYMSETKPAEATVRAQ